MDIQANVMAQVVREERIHGLSQVSVISMNSTFCPYISRKIESQLLQLVLQAIFGNSMELIEGEVCAFATERKTRPMHGEYSIVQIPLRI